MIEHTASELAKLKGTNYAMTEPTVPQPTGTPPTTLDRPGEPIARISTATLIIGSSGAGKTSLLETLAMYVWESYGRVLFLYSWDGGAIPTNIQKRMKQGIIRFWRVRTRSAPGLGIDTLYKATKGWVPKRINPETGETDPAVVMVPPVESTFAASCPAGHALSTVSFLALLQPVFCSACQKMITRDQMVIVASSKRTKGLDLIGAVAFDGLTSMTNVVMEHMDHARGAGDIGGEKPAFGGVVISGDTKLGGNNRADVGFGQSRAQQFVNNSLSIPYLVEGPVFTALTAEASEEGLAIVGAKLPGRAATDEASAWFGNVLEAGIYVDPNSGKEHRALYIRPFTDKQGRKHLLKTSGSPGNIPDMLIDPPAEDKRPFEGFNLGNYFRMLDDDLRKAVANQTRVAVDVGGYGEETVSSPAHQVPTPIAPTPAAVAPASPGTPAGPIVPPPLPQAPPKATKRAKAAPQAVGTAPVTAPAPPPAAAEASPPPAAAAAPSPSGPPPPPPGARPPQRAPGS